MSIEIAYYTFDGPYTSVYKIREAAGVYCVLCMLANGKVFPLDVGESENTRSAVREGRRKDCWVKDCKGTIAIAALYTPDQDQKGRVDIVKKILAWDYFPCSE